jgi:hypothetical protein
MSLQEPIFIIEQHVHSCRWAIVEEDEFSCWFYLTNSEKSPVADCWLYNRIVTPDELDKELFHGRPPPAIKRFVGPDAEEKTGGKFTIKWASDGESVSVLKDGAILGFIVQNTARGFSRHLILEGPWGKPFDSDLYRKIFED